MKSIAFLLAACVALPALAEESGRAPAMTPLYKSECGSCHVAYPANLLGKADWRRLMAGLDRHFGSDASLDAKSTAQIQAYLERNAGSSARLKSGREPRISTTAWFTKKHDEVPPRAWQDPRVKSAANCAACHRGAEQGRYGEREIAIPGMGRRYEED